MNILVKAIKSIPVQLAASGLILLGTWKLLGALDSCGTVVFLLLLARSLRRERTVKRV